MNEPQSADAIRKRPGMYIGDTEDGSGLAHMVWEVVANAVDEHLAGFCSRISVTIDEESAITVEDDGRGFPVEEVKGVRFAEHALTSFHDSPSLDGHAPHTHVGIHGLGVFVVCALSTRLELHVHRHGRHWLQHFAKGHATSGVGDCGPSTRSGTRLTFAPDPSIFPALRLDSTVVLRRLTELSFLLPSLTVQFSDRRVHTLHQPGGLAGHLASIARDAPVGSIFTLKETVEDVVLEVAARWDTRGSTNIRSFANTEQTTDGGTHVEGLLAGLTEGLKRTTPEIAHLPLKRRKSSVVRTLSALVCVRLDDPEYNRPTKSRLCTPRVQGIVKATVAAAFADFVAGEPALREHLTKPLIAQL